MGFSCKNCGGNVLFDIESQQLKCQHCGSSYSPFELSVQNRSKESPDAEPELRVFLCGSCGAQLEGTEESLVGKCPYCGNQSLLLSDRLVKETPEQILPFQISREKCKELFRERTEKVRYLASELRDPAYLDSFTGIYIPFITCDAELPPNHLEYSHVETYGGSEWRHHCSLDISAEEAYRSAPFDASRYLDDTITRQVLPYHMDKLQDYTPGFLSGFYADCATVSPEIYEADAIDQAQHDIQSKVYKRNAVWFPAGQLKLKLLGWRRQLYPMWFLTWRRGKRVAYSVLNGETGRLSVDLPIDYRRYALGCLCAALVLFAVLELLFQPTPTVAAVLSLLAGAVMSRAVRSRAQKIHDRQIHLYDKGWTGRLSLVEEPENRKRLTRFFILLGAAILLLILRPGRLAWFPMKAAAFALLWLVMDAADVLYYQRGHSEWHATFAHFLTLLSVLGVFLVFVLFPAADLWYYLGVGGSILLLSLSSLLMLRVYNISATRPLPRLFDREEVQ